MRRNSAVPSLASDPRKPYPPGPVMPKPENATGSDPAASIAVPSRRADSATVTGRVRPFSVRVAAAVRVTAAPAENAAGSGTGRVRVMVAYRMGGHAEAPGELRLARLPVRRDRGEADPERRAGYLGAGHRDRAGDVAGAPGDVVAEADDGLPDAEAGHRARGDPPGAVERAGRRGGVLRQRERRRPRRQRDDGAGRRDGEDDKREPRLRESTATGAAAATARPRVPRPSVPHGSVQTCIASVSSGRSAITASYTDR